MNYNIIIQSLVKHDNIVNGLNTHENSPKCFLLNRKLVNLKDPKQENALKKIKPFIQSKFNIELDEELFDEDWESTIPGYIDCLTREYKLNKREEQERQNLFEKKSLKFINEEMGISIKPNINFDNKEILPVDNTYVIKGPVQSGKTKTIIGYALSSLLKGIKPVIVVRNLNEDYHQMVDSIQRLHGSHKDYFNGNFNGNQSIYPGGISDIKDWIEEIGKTCIVLMGNGTQLRKFLDETKDKNQKYNVFIDEADQLLTSEVSNERNGDKSLKTTINELCDGAIKTFMVSATLNGLFQEEKFHLSENNFIYVNVDETRYHGIEYLSHEEVEENKTGGSLLENHRGMIQMVNTINRKSKPKTNNHPHICLGKFSNKNVDQQEFINHLHTTRRYAGKWATIIFNGNGVEISHYSLEDEEMIINDILPKKLEKSWIFKGVSIREAIGFFKQNGGVDRFPRIFIASGSLASRGINFVCNDYQWHITDEYLSQPKLTNTTNLIQGLRILGNHDDNMNLTLWSGISTWDNIKKAHSLETDLINKGKQQNMELNKVMKSTVIHKDRKPTIKMCKNQMKIKTTTNINQDNLDKVDMEFNDDKDLKRGLENVKKIWTTQKQGIVLNILKYFVNNCGIDGEIHMTALRERCGIILPSQYLTWSHKHGDYKILIKQPDNTFKLNPQVIQHLNLKNN